MQNMHRYPSVVVFHLSIVFACEQGFRVIESSGRLVL